MTGNTGPKGRMKGEKRISTEDHMQKFDSLPKALRVTISESPVDWGLVGMVKAFERKELANGREAATREMAELVKQEEGKLFDAANIGAVWGPGHPQARGATVQALGL